MELDLPVDKMNIEEEEDNYQEDIQQDGEIVGFDDDDIDYEDALKQLGKKELQDLFSKLDYHKFRVELLKKCKATTIKDIMNVIGDKHDKKEEETEVETTTTSKVNDDDAKDLKRYKNVMDILEEIVEDRYVKKDVKLIKMKELNCELKTLEQASELFSRVIKTGKIKQKEARINFLVSGKYATYIEEKMKTSLNKWGGMKKDAYCIEKLGVSAKTFDRNKKAWELYQDYTDIFCYSPRSVEYLVDNYDAMKQFFERTDNCADTFAGKLMREHWKKSYWVKTWTELAEEFK